MTMQEQCQKCGTKNHGSQPESDGTGAGVREIQFECSECGATGVVKTHKRAGILGRTGNYFDSDQ